MGRPVCFVSKRDSQPQFCIDYFKLNVTTLKDSYPVLRIHICMVSIGQKIIFSTLNANSYYCQMYLRKEN